MKLKDAPIGAIFRFTFLWISFGGFYFKINEGFIVACETKGGKIGLKGKAIALNPEVSVRVRKD
jgi:hypothetical protein